MTSHPHHDTELDALLRKTLGGPLPEPSPFLATRIKAFSRLPQQTAWSWHAAALPPLFTGWMRGAAAFAVTASLVGGMLTGAIETPSVAKLSPQLTLQTTTEDADLPGFSSAPFSSLEEMY